MIWGLNAQSGHSSLWLDSAGTVGYLLLLPTMLLGYAVERVGGLGMPLESILTIVAQFLGYLGLVYSIHRLRQRKFQFGLRALLVSITVLALILGYIAWAANR
jgi:hypothetical protein